MAESKNKAADKAAEQGIDGTQIEDLEQQTRQKVILEIEGMTVDRFRESFGELYAKIASDILDQDKNKSLGKEPGFLLELDDPYALAAERVFTRNGGVGARVIVRKLETSKLPMILPFGDKASKPAMESYLQRAQGAGDTERSQRAKDALQKCK